MIESIKFSKEKIEIIDQTLLPVKEKYIPIENYQAMIDAIQRLSIRGAPAIGIAGSAAAYLASQECKNAKELYTALDEIEGSRPTAVNLSFAIQKIRPLLKTYQYNTLEEIIFNKTIELMTYEKNACELMGKNALKLIPTSKPLKILTHCNTGSLATYGIGTALGVIRTLAKHTDVHVFVDETRPLLQGSRLTAWELQKSGVKATLITDNMAAFMIQKNNIDCIITGADRIAKNGDSANKIGTFNLSILAQYFGIPFYIVAPESTIDREIITGDTIRIEERKADEVRTFQGKTSAPFDIPVANPAFDVAPANLIKGIITDNKAYIYPYNFE